MEEYKNQCTTEFSTSCQTEYNTKVRYLDFEIVTFSLLICISARLNMKNCARRRTIKSATQNMIRLSDVHDFYVYLVSQQCFDLHDFYENLVLQQCHDEFSEECKTEYSEECWDQPREACHTESSQVFTLGCDYYMWN